MADVKQFVDQTIAGNKVVIFSKTYCPYCVKAKQAIGSVMDMSNVVVVELDKRPDGDAIQDYLLSITGGRSVPRVFIVLFDRATRFITPIAQGGKFIGGGDDTARLRASGELETLLKAAGAI